jgi:hypothetical protein
MVESSIGGSEKREDMTLEMPYNCGAAYGVGVHNINHLAASPFKSGGEVEFPERMNPKSICKFVENIQDYTEALSLDASVSAKGYGATVKMDLMANSFSAYNEN